MQTLQNFTQELREAIAERMAHSKDPNQEVLTLAKLNEIIQSVAKKEVLTLADLNEIIQRVIAGAAEWRHEPGYPRTLSKASPDNTASLSQLQRGLGPPMKTIYCQVESRAEEEEARARGWS